MTEAAPEVSVVVPCHAAAQTIGPLLEALRAQTLDPARYEVIVVDPAADGTRRVLTAFSVVILSLTLIASVFGMNVGAPAEGGMTALWVMIAIMVAMVSGMRDYFNL